MKEYSREFWKNWEKIENGQKYVERIEKGEQEIQKRKAIDMAIEEKFKILREEYVKENGKLDGFSIEDIKLTKIGESGKKNVVYINPGNSLAYTLEEDRFLAYCLFKYGYGQWELIRNEFRNSPLFLFNWAVKCRSL